MEQIPFPRTGAPALRALANAGYTHLRELDGIPMRSVLDLHGMGPKGIGALRRAMADHGWGFADDDPSVGAVQGGRVSLTEGTKPERNDNTNLRAGGHSAREWVASLPKARQREQGEAMLDLFGEVTGEDPTMWGPSIVGYGALHYVYESGREGDMPRVAFSPRSSALTFYGLAESPEAVAMLDRLGKHKRSVACVYVTKLEDVDDGVLRELVEHAWANNGSSSADG